MKVQKRNSTTGNRTRVFRMTGGDTYHYTIEDHTLQESSQAEQRYTPGPNFYGEGVKKKLPDRESNPGLPRDRRRYLPLYYRGPHTTSIQPMLSNAIPGTTILKKGAKSTKKELPDRESNPGLPRDRRRYLPLYYRGPHTTAFSQCRDHCFEGRCKKYKKGAPRPGIEPGSSA